MRPFKRVKHILSKAISILVILICLALLITIWIFQDDVSSSAVAIFAEVDNVAQVMRNGIGRIEPEINTLRSLIGGVETASEEISQNISEEGIIPRLLPQSVVAGLTTSSQSLQDNFMAVNNLLDATSDILLALDNMPFIDIPEKGLSTIATLQDTMEEISGQIETLKTNIDELRSEAAGKISQVTNAAIFLGEEVDQFRSDLIQIDNDLDAIQTSVRRYQRLTPPVIISTAIILSLLSAWVVYSQVIMFSRSGNLNPVKINDTAGKSDPSLDEEHLV